MICWISPTKRWTIWIHFITKPSIILLKEDESFVIWPDCKYQPNTPLNILIADNTAKPLSHNKKSGPFCMMRITIKTQWQCINFNLHSANYTQGTRLSWRPSSPLNQPTNQSGSTYSTCPHLTPENVNLMSPNTGAHTHTCGVVVMRYQSGAAEHGTRQLIKVVS